MTSDIRDLVSKVQTDTPLPADWRDLPAALQRQIERRAEETGLTPAQVYAAMKAQAEADLGTDSLVSDVAAAIQRTRRGAAG